MNKFDIQKLRRANVRVCETMTSVLTENPLSENQWKKHEICDLLNWALEYIQKTENMSIDEILSVNCGHDLRRFDAYGNIEEGW